MFDEMNFSLATEQIPSIHTEKFGIRKIACSHYKKIHRKKRDFRKTCDGYKKIQNNTFWYHYRNVICRAWAKIEGIAFRAEI